MEKNTISGTLAGLSCELDLRWASVSFVIDGIDFSPPPKKDLFWRDIKLQEQLSTFNCFLIFQFVSFIHINNYK